MTPSLGLMNFLEWSYRTQGNSLTLLDHWYITKDIKECESTIRGRDSQDKTLNAKPVSSKSGSLGPARSMWKSSGSSAWKLPQPLLWIFLAASWHMQD